MTPTEKHRADAARVFLDIVRDAPCEGIDGGACWSATVAGKIIASALANSEREGMKRAAEIASRDADWSRFGKREVHEPWEGGPDDARDYRIGIVAGRAIAAAILSEAGEG